ncbi:hypothetical protein FHX44_116619 [Pseudonocardia hierapolitana]|uniref:Uncharacterized protein n=1 Tax=Pseudonocardia hierapolitana TaxID=1128676 RepID=A0A561T0M6_9PSEU|nr:hypothetical protein [Pseudonocardia hierapolitana]TWF80676.1 hypothetical protein FHX44_116619 [Pseudonocardia hierapolitana]
MGSGEKRRITRRKSPDAGQVPESRSPLPWRNDPSEGVNHVADANGKPVYDGPDAAEMFRLYSAEADREPSRE